jgi:uncharacterized protein YndB with AHSA1/START domain
MATRTKSPAAKVGAMRIEQEITIQAPPARVFEALTKELSAWWGAPYLIREDSRDLVCEPTLGGRVFEDWGKGEGGLWATVTGIRRPDYLEWTGRIGMSGAVTGVVAFTLEPKGNATLLKLSHRAAGEVTSQTQAGYGDGWQDLLGGRLKVFVEKGTRRGVRQ